MYNAKTELFFDHDQSGNEAIQRNYLTEDLHLVAE